MTALAELCEEEGLGFGFGSGLGLGLGSGSSKLGLGLGLASPASLTCSESLRHGLGTLPQLPAPHGDSNAPDGAKRTAPLPDHSHSLGVASMLLLGVGVRVRMGVGLGFKG